jgi:regulatory protein
MDMIQISALTSGEKGRAALIFEDGTSVTLYRGELRKAAALEGKRILCEGDYIKLSTYDAIFDTIVVLRAKKRAMHLLERMDRTEWQLRNKLIQNGYPARCIDIAIDYVKSFHYIDDFRYSCAYIRCTQDKKSRERLKIDLLRKGVAKNIIEHALDEEYSSDECDKIREIIDKRHFDPNTGDVAEKRRIYQYLLRRGYRSRDILNVINSSKLLDRNIKIE